MLQWLHTYVAIVCSQCFICFFRRLMLVCLSGYCIYFTHMLQVFIWMLHMFCNGFQVCFVSVSDTCFKYLIYLQTYIASVASGCFKSRSGVAHVVMWPTYRSLLLLLGRCRGSPCGLLRPADASAACIHRWRWGGRGRPAPVCYDAAGYGQSSVMGTRWGVLLLCGDRTGRGTMDALEWEQHLDCCGRTLGR
jgi:hypothetical protein